MKSSALSASLLLVTNAFGSPLLRRANAPAVVDASNGVTYVGNSARGVESFLNIKFGQDTGGSNRFRAPQPFSYASNAVVNASVPGAACPQQKVPYEGIQIFDNVTNVSEDCLTLRIDRPANISSDAKLPVLVWIYGGGFSIGQIYDAVYTPSALVASSAVKKLPAIYVAMNYRVGIFGFASSPGISPDDLNMGLLDQRLALQWVQQNIHYFGGDSNNVTLFGESAGADSVGLHLVSYAGNTSMAPPFQRAIIQSGGPTSQLGITSNITANHTAVITDRVNCTSPTGNHTAEVACLRNLPLETLLTVSTNFSIYLEPPGGFNVFSPVVPSTIIPSPPSQLLSSGRFYTSISLISGWAENDGSLFVPPSIRTEADIRTWFATTSNLSNSVIDQVLTLYPVTSFQDCPIENITAQWFRASQIARDRDAACPSLLINSAMANFSFLGNNTNTTNYLYVLNATLFTPFFVAANTTYLGVPHFSDIPFVFDQAAYPLYRASNASIALANQISASWAAFGSTGNPAPSRTGNLTASPWTQGASSGVGTEFQVRVLGGPKDGMASIDLDGGSGSGLPLYGQDLVRRCQFWNSMEILEMNGT